jgi:high-affinity iron transporter
MTISVFMVIQFGENTISGLGAEAIAGIASLVAVAIVTTMVLWMKKAAAGISGQLRAEMADALQAGALAVVTLSFLAVGREASRPRCSWSATPKRPHSGRWPG